MHLNDVIKSIGWYRAFVAFPIQTDTTNKSTDTDTGIGIGASLVWHTCIKVFERRAGFGYRSTVSVYHFLLHYPTRDMQISYKLAFSYPNNSVIRTFLKIEKYKGGWITEGLLYIYLYITILYFAWADQRDKVCFIFHKVQGCCMDKKAQL